MVEPIHHYHRRKRIHVKHEPYPHPHKFKRFLDKIIYIVGVVGPILTIPQITKIWTEQDASNVSLTSWSGYLCLSFIWLTYGIAHKEKPIIFTFIANIIVQSVVVTSIIIYR